MSYGYPGSNSQLENHNVTEESFWPSFSDIMMVIVMVFLLVTVAVILNNWALISKLTNSVEAQKAASSLANNRKVENQNLEKKLSSVEQNLSALNAQFKKEKAALEKTQEKLSTAAQTLSLKEQSLASIENKLSTLNQKYIAEKLRLSNTNQQLSVSEKKLSNTDKELIEIKQQLANKITIIDSLDKKLLEATTLNQNTQASLNETNLLLEETQTKLSGETEKLTKEQNKLLTANKSISQLQASMADLETEKESLSQINQTKKKELEDSALALARVNVILEKTETEVSELKKADEASNKEIVKLKATVEDSNNAVLALQTDRSVMDERLKDLLTSLKSSKKQLDESKKWTIQRETELAEKLALLEKKNVELTETFESVKVSEENLKLQLTEKNTQVSKLQKTIDESNGDLINRENELLEKITFLEKEKLEHLRITEKNKVSEDKLKKLLADKEIEVTNLQETISETQETAKAIEATVLKSEKSLKSFEELLVTAEEQIIERDKRIEDLTAAQKEGNSQLLSLQGEYDSLDSKYQKLLRPARSSKGKFVATVTYKKVGGKRVIRFKSSPNGSYKTVNNKQLAKSLEALKKKHKKELYVKVVIPQNSGLSYNEAWRFTINLQRKYDYYYNE